METLYITPSTANCIDNNGNSSAVSSNTASYGSNSGGNTKNGKSKDCKERNKFFVTNLIFIIFLSSQSDGESFDFRNFNDLI